MLCGCILQAQLVDLLLEGKTPQHAAHTDVPDRKQDLEGSDELKAGRLQQNAFQEKIEGYNNDIVSKGCNVVICLKVTMCLAGFIALAAAFATVEEGTSLPDVEQKCIGWPNPDPNPNPNTNPNPDSKAGWTTIMKCSAREPTGLRAKLSRR